MSQIILTPSREPMVSTRPTFARRQLRDQIAADTAAFLAAGGKIRKCPQGASGRIDGLTPGSLESQARRGAKSNGGRG